MTDDQRLLTLAATFFEALERGDAAAIIGGYAPDARIWNNAQQVEMTGSEHVDGLRDFFFNRFRDRTYQESRTDLLADGFVSQQVLTATVEDSPVRIPMCLIVRVMKGRIARIDEYLTLSAIPNL